MGARRGARGETDQQNVIMHKACPAQPWPNLRGTGTEVSWLKLGLYEVSANNCLELKWRTISHKNIFESTLLLER